MPADPTPERIAQAVADLRSETQWARVKGTKVRLWQDDAEYLIAHIDALTAERDEARRALAATLAHDSVASGDLDRARAARGRGETVGRDDAQTLIWDPHPDCPACLRGIDHQHATVREG